MYSDAGPSRAAVERVRSAVAGLVDAAGSQSAFARSLGVSQPTIWRLLRGGRLGTATARRLHAAYPGLRRLLEVAVLVEPVTGDGEPSEAAS